MKLHVGAGDKYWPGFVNIDAVGQQDIVWDIRDLRLGPNIASEIHAIHCLEHINRMQADDTIKIWRNALMSNGVLYIELPCLDKILDMMVAGEKNQVLTLFGLYGDPRHEDPLMSHKWCWSKKEITEFLSNHGFSVSIEEPLFHIPARDMRVVAVKQEIQQ